MKYIKTFVFTGALVIAFGFVAEANKIQKPSFSLTAQKTTPNQSLVENLTSSFLNKTPVQDFPPNLTLEEGKQIQAEFIQSLSPILGKPVGYKAGLTSQSAQTKFNVSHPLRGVLLAEMLLPNPAVVSPNFGAIPLVEGDLMVRVGSEDINTATTTTEVLASLDAVIPFIELPDLVYAENIPLNAPNLQAINVGARLGVMGHPIPLQPTPEWEEKLGKIQLIILDETGNQLAMGESNALLGHPLNVVLWLRDSLQAEGKSLHKGDLLSLGTITPLMPVNPGTTIRAQYLGLNSNEPVEISVKFQ
ncbi:MAG: hydratase [Gomphosphaeria aponina SAG 52.96 = DSM 107014]|uniref:Hydratase n=1 Tax=Gomphosphaeria aponina SAG 52.96 = DSM 107014 TaxID=1521640 RepID=A0A941GR98_9CHRO|nr:hydratase [Gomphosphaeria aponina SAG 52.96 = DSM 107014]